MWVIEATSLATTGRWPKDGGEGHDGWARCRASRALASLPDVARRAKSGGAPSATRLKLSFDTHLRDRQFLASSQTFRILSPLTCELEQQIPLLGIVRLRSRADAVLRMIFIQLSQSWHVSPVMIPLARGTLAVMLVGRTGRVCIELSQSRWGLKKKSPGGDRGSSTSPRQGVRGGCWSRGRESGLQRGHHAQLCRAALFPREQAQRLRCSIARLVANLIRPCQSYAAAFRTPFQAFPYPLGMRSGLVDDLAGEVAIVTRACGCSARSYRCGAPVSGVTAASCDLGAGPARRARARLSDWPPPSAAGRRDRRSCGHGCRRGRGRWLPPLPPVVRDTERR